MWMHLKMWRGFKDDIGWWRNMCFLYVHLCFLGMLLFWWREAFREARWIPSLCGQPEVWDSASVCYVHVWAIQRCSCLLSLLCSLLSYLDSFIICPCSCSRSRVILLKAREFTGTAAMLQKRAEVEETETIAYLRMWVIWGTDLQGTIPLKSVGYKQENTGFQITLWTTVPVERLEGRWRDWLSHVHWDAGGRASVKLEELYVFLSLI